MTKTEPCTWNIEKLDEDDNLIKAPCGHNSHLAFSRVIKSRGRLPRLERHPRCKKHASAKTVEWAEKHGYKVKYLEE